MPGIRGVAVLSVLFLAGCSDHPASAFARPGADVYRGVLKD